MPYPIDPATPGTSPTLQICDASSGSVRLAGVYPHSEASLTEEERELQQLSREEASHELFRRLFLRTSERYLKGELSDSGPL